MKTRKETGLDFVIDKLTNSIQNVITGDSFATEISVLTSQDLKNIAKKNGWLFDWKEEFKNPKRDTYKLTIVHNPTVIQGLISLEVKSDHVYMHLVENAPFNKGKSKVYAGVSGNLVAFACKLFSKEDTRAMFRSYQKHNSLTITKRHLARFISEDE